MEMEKIVNYCKNYGYIFPGSEIYGGLANTWDYGPLGVELKNNIKKAWWKRFIAENPNSYGVDAGILMNPTIWKASGHVDSFTDPLIDCKECKARHRADHLIEGFTDEVVPDTMTDEEMVSYNKEHNIPCPSCGKSNYTDVREFNLMFETNRGVIKDATSKVYLRPETAQGEFVNFLNVSGFTPIIFVNVSVKYSCDKNPCFMDTFSIISSVVLISSKELYILLLFI